jgi:hypothetical protein
MKSMTTLHFKYLVTNLYLLTAYPTREYLVIILTFSTNLFPFFVDFYSGKSTLITPNLTALNHFVDFSFTNTAKALFVLGLMDISEYSPPWCF